MTHRTMTGRSPVDCLRLFRLVENPCERGTNDVPP